MLTRRASEGTATPSLARRVTNHPPHDLTTPRPRHRTTSPPQGRSQPVADRPQVREHRVEQRPLQELDAERTARPLLAANRPLHQLDVPVTPLLEPLVEVRHQLEED